MTPKRITIHCSASPGKKTTSEKVLKWHREERNWRTIGYHYCINWDGHIDSRTNKEYFRGLNEIGAGVKGQNKDNVHICLFGDKSFTKPQFHALHKVIHDLMLIYPITYGDIYTHNYFNRHKGCPNMEWGKLVAYLITGDLKYVQSYIFKKRKGET